MVGCVKHQPIVVAKSHQPDLGVALLLIAALKADYFTGYNVASVDFVPPFNLIFGIGCVVDKPAYISFLYVGVSTLVTASAYIAQSGRIEMS